MIKTSVLTSVLILLSLCTIAQTPINVAENKVRVAASGEEVLYYGFAEGDQVIFSLEEINGKELKEIEIAAVDASSLFLDYKTKKIENKILNIPETGIYKFRFANSNLLSARICQFKIQRIPASGATAKFNSTVYKRTVFDTTYYDAQERYLVKGDTVATEVFTQTAKVHSQLNMNTSKTVTNFRLPANTISWSYYIGVDQAGQQAYEAATKQFVTQSAPAVTKLLGASPLTALALGFTSYLAQMQSGEDIDYYLVEGANSNLFYAGRVFRYYKSGKVINDFAKMEPITGNLSFCFSNDNAVQGVTVFVKVTAVTVNSIWDTRQVRKQNVSSRQEMYLKN